MAAKVKKNTPLPNPPPQGGREQKKPRALTNEYRLDHPDAVSVKVALTRLASRRTRLLADLSPPERSKLGFQSAFAEIGAPDMRLLR